MGSYNQNTAYDGPKQITKNSIPEGRIDELEKMSEQLSNLIATLRTRLKPVLSESPKADCKPTRECAQEKFNCNSILNQRLQSLKDRYQDTLDRLSDLMQDIEL